CSSSTCRTGSPSTRASTPRRIRSSPTTALPERSTLAGIRQVRSFPEGFILPLDRVTDRDEPIVEHLSENTSAPRRPHRGAKAGQRLVHPLTRSRLTRDPEAAVRDAKHPAAASGEIDSPQENVRASGRWIQIRI